MTFPPKKAPKKGEKKPNPFAKGKAPVFQKGKAPVFAKGGKAKKPC